MRTTALVVVAAISCLFPQLIAAQVTWYTDEASYLAVLAAEGYVPVQESFEDDAAWGGVRSVIGGTQTAPSVTNLGVTWASSSANNEITTGAGPARTGAWGFFSLPHGDYAAGITDGWRGTATQPLVAIGGWVETNTPVAALVVFLDGDEQAAIDFGGNNVLTTSYKFFGVIDPAGFSVFDFRETEGTIGDQKYIFSDDFTFAFSGVLQDCNENGISDGFDIGSGTSSDCNLNTIPDECELDENSSAPGGPFFCTMNCAPDCNDNGLLDECEVVMPEVHESGPLSPIGFGAPQSFTIVSPPATHGDVLLSFVAYANLGGGPDHISVDLNGVWIGDVFGQSGNDCPENEPDMATLLVPQETFNSAVNGGDAVIDMVASDEVDPFDCDLPTSISVEVQLFVPSAADQNEDGIPDDCVCTQFIRGEVNGDGVANVADAIDLLGFLFTGGAEPIPVLEAGDANGDATLDVSDPIYLLGYLFAGGAPPPAPFPDPGCDP